MALKIDELYFENNTVKIWIFRGNEVENMCHYGCKPQLAK